MTSKKEQEKGYITFRGTGKSVQEGVRAWISENRDRRLERSSASLAGPDHVVMTVEYSEKKGG